MSKSPDVMSDQVPDARAPISSFSKSQPQPQSQTQSEGQSQAQPQSSQASQSQSVQGPPVPSPSNSTGLAFPAGTSTSASSSNVPSPRHRGTSSPPDAYITTTSGQTAMSSTTMLGSTSVPAALDPMIVVLRIRPMVITARSDFAAGILSDGTDGSSIPTSGTSSTTTVTTATSTHVTNQPDPSVVVVSPTRVKVVVSPASTTVAEGYYDYTHVFGPDASQFDVYNYSAAPLVEKVFRDNSRGLIFAYGVTASGKTHTMQGTPNEPGIIGNVLTDIFARVQKLAKQDRAARQALVRLKSSMGDGEENQHGDIGCGDDYDSHEDDYESDEEYEESDEEHGTYDEEDAKTQTRSGKTTGKGNTSASTSRTGTPSKSTRAGTPSKTTRMGSGDKTNEHTSPRTRRSRALNIGDWRISISYLEIYNKNVNDLLSIVPKNNLMIKGSTATGFHAEGLTEQFISSPREAMQFVAMGQQRRKTSSTSLNADSSRSHSVMIFKIYSPLRTEFGRISVVDLAGSERSQKVNAGTSTQAPNGNDAREQNERKTETNAINQSLSALGSALKALRERQNGSGRSAPQVSLRESKLTQLFSENLSGLGPMSMICCVNPSPTEVGETVNTLKYAAMASEIKSVPRIVTVNTAYNAANAAAAAAAAAASAASASTTSSTTNPSRRNGPGLGPSSTLSSGRENFGDAMRGIIDAHSRTIADLESKVMTATEKASELQNVNTSISSAFVEYLESIRVSIDSLREDHMQEVARLHRVYQQDLEKNTEELTDLFYSQATCMAETAARQATQRTTFLLQSLALPVEAADSNEMSDSPLQARGREIRAIEERSSRREKELLEANARLQEEYVALVEEARKVESEHESRYIELKKGFTALVTQVRSKLRILSKHSQSAPSTLSTTAASSTSTSSSSVLSSYVPLKQLDNLLGLHHKTEAELSHAKATVESLRTHTTSLEEEVEQLRSESATVFSRNRQKVEEVIASLGSQVKLAITHAGGSIGSESIEMINAHIENQIQRALSFISSSMSWQITVAETPSMVTVPSAPVGVFESNNGASGIGKTPRKNPAGLPNLIPVAQPVVTVRRVGAGITSSSSTSSSTLMTPNKQRPLSSSSSSNLGSSSSVLGSGRKLQNTISRLPMSTSTSSSMSSATSGTPGASFRSRKRTSLDMIDESSSSVSSTISQPPNSQSHVSSHGTTTMGGSTGKIARLRRDASGERGMSGMVSSLSQGRVTRSQARNAPQPTYVEEDSTGSIYAGVNTTAGTVPTTTNGGVGSRPRSRLGPAPTSSTLMTGTPSKVKK